MNEFATTHVRNREGFKVVEVDTEKAVYQGIKWRDLGDFGKRKFQNLLVLSDPRERLKIRYI